MKIQILRAFVLLVSISAVSALVWNATRNEKSDETLNNGGISSEEMLGSSKSKAVGVDFDFMEDDLAVSPKSGPVVTDDELREMVEDPAEAKVTDEDVKRTRDTMMSTSKSGRIMSDDQIRKMLEERKKEELEIKSKPPLMHSSKSFIGPVIEAKELEKIIEGDNQELPPLEEAK